MTPAQTFEQPWNREQDEFAQLVSCYLDNVASEQDFSRLQLEMASNPEKQRLFVHLNLQFSLLCEALQGTRAVSMLESTSVDEMQAADDGWTTDQWIDSDDDVIPTDRQSSVLERQAQDRSTSPAPTFPTSLFPSTLGYSAWTISYLSSAVITGLLILGFWLMPASDPKQVARNTGPSVVEPIAEPKAYVGRITGMVDCKWTGGSRVSLGQKCELASGLLEITYNTGAKVILQGPVTYSVEANGGYLAVGKLTGKLEKRTSNPQSLIPNPFVIRTPTAIVTDLGTEFGVEVSSKGVTETQVLIGAVKIAVLGERNNDVKEQVVHAGSAVRVDSRRNRLVAVPPKEMRFVRTLSPRALDTDAYAEMVLSMKPFAYYRMEPPKDRKDRLVVLIQRPAAITARSIFPTNGRASRGRAVDSAVRCCCAAPWQATTWMCRTSPAPIRTTFRCRHGSIHGTLRGIALLPVKWCPSR